MLFWHATVIVDYLQMSSKVGAQLAAKKKQSSNSSCVAAVLRFHRK